MGYDIGFDRFCWGGCGVRVEEEIRKGLIMGG